MNNKELQADLFGAIDANNLRRVEVLIDMGVDLGAERSISPLSNSPAYATPIQYAITKDRKEIVELFKKQDDHNGIISQEDKAKANTYLDKPEGEKQGQLKEKAVEIDLCKQDKLIKKDKK